MNKCPMTVSGNHKFEKKYTDLAISFEIACKYCGLIDDTYVMTDEEKAESRKQYEFYKTLASRTYQRRGR